jgi:hypothetical protein
MAAPLTVSRTMKDFAPTLMRRIKVAGKHDGEAELFRNASVRVDMVVSMERREGGEALQLVETC